MNHLLERSEDVKNCDTNVVFVCHSLMCGNVYLIYQISNCLLI